MNMFFKRVITFTILFVVGLVFIVLVAPEWPAFQSERYKLKEILGQRDFDFLTWELETLALKGETALTSGQDFLDQETRKKVVLEYLEFVAESNRLEFQINLIYTDPEVTDPLSTSATLRSELDEKRGEIAKRQPLAEAILQEQVANVLADEKFEFLGQAWPPVQMHVTEMPFALIVSPREEIRQIYNIPLEHGLEVSVRENIENAIYDTVDRSALVVRLGGIGFYPAIIVETSSINRLVDVIAHEWAHHWLVLHPLGLSVFASPELLAINETVASIVGTEIGQAVLEQYYPEFLPQDLATDGNASADPQPDDDQPPLFDFRAEMAKTRNKVDELLAEGKVEEAELYMEERRLFFWENGYRIRKINQAFFSFFGSYADVPGEQGDNPIGPTLLALRESSPTLRSFMDQVAPINQIDELWQIAAESGVAIPG